MPRLEMLASAAGEADEAARNTSFIEIALVIFLVVFVLITAWVLLARRGAFNRHARIPLEDEPVEPREPPAEPLGELKAPDPSPPEERDR